MSRPPARERLPDRRPAETFDLEMAGLKYKVTAGYFADGRPAEIFVSNHKSSNGSDVAARDAGTLVSLLLQHGCDLAIIAHAISRKSDATASGVIGAVLDKILLAGREGGR
jgi:hypothetical protein